MNIFIIFDTWLQVVSQVQFLAASCHVYGLEYFFPNQANH